MSRNIAIDLIALCEEILDDEEVTLEEVASLGQWLATHEEANRSWPGNILVQPVQKAMLDGRITKTELKKIASLLRVVQKEWVKLRELQVKEASKDKATEAARNMNLSIALLPSIPITLPVKSHSDNTIIYNVDLTGPSCNCPDWISNRIHLPKGDLTRCCKHVIDAFARIQPDNGWPAWFGAFIGQGWKPHPAKRWSVIYINSGFVLISVGGTDWSDVFAAVRCSYQRFGYNIIDGRWSYGNEPPYKTEIQKTIRLGLREPHSSVGLGGYLRRLFGL